MSYREEARGVVGRLGDLERRLRRVERVARTSSTTPGDDGADGSSVLSGTYAPNSSEGSNGDYWIDYVSWFIYGPKAGGAWPAGVSLVGPPGEDGDDGGGGDPDPDPAPLGPSVLSGTAPPGPSDGSNGDFWIDYSAWVIYGPKASGAWPVGVPLTGPPGDDGLSAYEVAVDNGFVGSEAAWLASLEGADGDDGNDGNTVLNGTGAPSGGVGVDGDFYYDPTAKLMYGPKAGGVWPAGVSLAGSAGAAGVVAATAPVLYNSGTQTVSLDTAKVPTNIWQHQMPAFLAWKAASATPTRSINNARWLGGFVDTVNVSGNWIEWHQQLDAGTWTLIMFHDQLASSGNATLTLDGVSIGSVTLYNVSTVVGQVSTITGITVATTGAHVLRSTNSSGGGGGANYVQRWEALAWLRTA